MGVYSNNVLALDPVAYWPLDDDSGNFADSSGNANTATASNTPLYRQAGPQDAGVNLAVDFNGSTQYGEVASALAQASGCTLAGWVKTDDTASQQTILSIGNSSGVQYVRLALQGGSAPAAARVYAQVRWDASNVSESSSASSYTGGWHLMAATFNGNHAIAYLDGVAGSSVAYTTPGTLDVTGLARLSRASPVQYFNGRLAGLAIWDKVLTPAEIAGLARTSPPFRIRPNLTGLRSRPQFNRIGR